MQGLAQYPALLLLFLGLILAEMAWRLWPARRGYDFRAAAATLGVAVIGAVLKAPGAAVVAAAFAGVAALAPHTLPADDWRVWAGGFLLVEFAYYWFHRFSHRVRWLWATHAVHHTPEEFTLLAAARLGWTNVLSGGWLLYLPLVAAGFPPTVIAALIGANLSYQFLLHTEAVGRLGPLEWVLNTPSHHRVHHASNPAYLDRNYGGVLIVFDRLFGTFQAELPAERPRYGLVHGQRSRNPVVIALHEWRNLIGDAVRARSPRQVAATLFGPPR
ncbi:MAG: sterol desaturase family protein [Alphaproteobacteria bacterium]